MSTVAERTVVFAHCGLASVVDATYFGRVCNALGDGIVARIGHSPPRAGEEM